MYNICLTSESEIKKTVVRKVFGDNINLSCVSVETEREQPFNVINGKRDSLICGFSRILSQATNFNDYDYIISIENGVIKLENTFNIYVDIVDVYVYDCKENKIYSTFMMPFEEMVKIPIPLKSINFSPKGEPIHGKNLTNISDIYDTSKTFGSQIAINFDFHKKNNGSDGSNWMSHLGMDRHYQIEKSLRYVYDCLKCNLQARVKDKVILTKDFPQEGILFQDYQNIFGDLKLKKDIASYFGMSLFESDISTESYLKHNENGKLVNDNLIVAGPELRGYMGTYIADLVGCNHSMIRKRKGVSKYKMAGNVVNVKLAGKEYKDTNEVEEFYCLKETFEGKKVILFDDVLATGGSIVSCCELIEKCGGEIVRLCFLANVPECYNDTIKLLEEKGYENMVDIILA